jgi:hypothetical protein
MKIEDLPEDLREIVEGLRHGSLTIQCDIDDALENAENLQDFKERASGAMDDLMNEAGAIKKSIRPAASTSTHRKLTEAERDRMVDVYAEGPLTYIPRLDDPLIALGLLSFYDDTKELEAVVARNKEDYFYEKNGMVKLEWYGDEETKEESEVPVEMDAFREMAADVIDYVTEAIQEEYPDLTPKKEFLEESADAAILYGEPYYTLESMIEDKLRELFYLKTPGRLPSEQYWRGDLRIISHHGEPVVLLEIEDANSMNIQAFIDEFTAGNNGYFGDSDFIAYLKSRNIRVRSHAFEELATGGIS